MAPFDLEEEIAARDAEAALAFLVEQEMVEVADDTITVPARLDIMALSLLVKLHPARWSLRQAVFSSD